MKVEKVEVEKRKLKRESGKVRVKSESGKSEIRKVKVINGK